MSITTKTGDQGQTSLFTGERLWKDDPRVEAYATVDELNSVLGLAKHFTAPDLKERIEGIQRLLFRVCSELASTQTDRVETINDADVQGLEEAIGTLERAIPLTGFVVPGHTMPSAYLDLCRVTARRAERRVITLSHTVPVSPLLRRWLNRLSDLLHLMARSEEQRLAGGPRYVKE